MRITTLPVWLAALALAGLNVSRQAPALLPRGEAQDKKTWKMLGASHPMAAHSLDSRLIYQMGKRADAREGVSSFLEKRPAAFTMSVADDVPEPFPFWQTPPYEPGDADP